MNIKQKSGLRYLAILVLLYVIFRFPILLSYTDTENYELLRGTFSKELIEGLQYPWQAFVTDAYSMAAPFNGLLTVPFFLIFGQTLFALKLVPFFWHLCSLIAWFFVWRYFFPLRQTFWILILFVFSAPRIVEYMLSNHGTHFESILWTAFSILILQRVFLKKISPLIGGCLLGLLGGFSSTLILINLVTVFVILFYTALAIDKDKKKFYFFYLIAFLVGFAPLLIYNSQHAWVGFLDIVGPPAFHRLGTVGFLENFQMLFFKWGNGLKGLLAFRDLPRPLTPIFTFGYEGIYLIALIVLAVRKWGFWKEISGRLDIEAFGLLFQLLLFFVVFIQFRWGERYLFPLVPFMGMTIVSALQAVKPFLRYVGLGFCLVAGLIGNLSLIHWRDMGKPLSMPGYSYEELGEVLKAHHE